MKYLTIILSIFFTVFTVHAETTISTVDVARLFEGSSQFREGKKKLDEKAAQLAKKAKEKREALATLEKQIKEKSEAGSASELETFRNEVKNLERFSRDSQEELSQEFAKLRKAVGDKVLKAVNDYAKDKKLDLVLDKGEAGRSAVLFGSSEADITDEIIKRLNG